MRAFDGKKSIALFKRSDAAVIAAWLAAALLLFLFSAAGVNKKNAGARLEITYGKELYGTYSLDEDRTVEIGDGNVCEIRNGEVRMTDADCPDKLCVKSRAISKTGESIVCLPNHVILKITGSDEDNGIDAVSE